MLMMLGVGAACGKKGGQLTLMMLGVGAARWEKRGPTDAHDAGGWVWLVGKRRPN